ncbi:hypothetical protein [Arthrobacter sedimenti]|uniref:hypothetical protein n=1 Tax=Arthrobacter sedimenti TaxID=2694931 RepID=UPI000B359AED|nr:hypothetical protein [Arthrobacter sedimenti]OUM40858.1 hypothetical protein B8W73_10740 [Arthrobacter agilis]
MGIEDELRQYLSDEDETDNPAKPKRQVVVELIAEVQSTAVEIANARGSRGVPTEPIMVMSDKPSSAITHFFKGDLAKPWIEADRGWAVLPYMLLVDNFGGLWGWGRIIVGAEHEGGRNGWVPLGKLESWQHQFSRDIPASHAFVLLGNSDSLQVEQDGDSSQLILNLGTRVGNHYEYDRRPRREHMIRGAAELISASR